MILEVSASCDRFRMHAHGNNLSFPCLETDAQIEAVGPEPENSRLRRTKVVAESGSTMQSTEKSLCTVVRKDYHSM